MPWTQEKTFSPSTQVAAKIYPWGTSGVVPNASYNHRFSLLYRATAGGLLPQQKASEVTVNKAFYGFEGSNEPTRVNGMSGSSD